MGKLLNFIDDSSCSDQSVEHEEDIMDDNNNNIGHDPHDNGFDCCKRNLFLHWNKARGHSSEEQAKQQRPDCSPFLIWKRKFMWDYQCPEEDIYKEIFFSSIPHIATFLAMSLHILSGAFLFMQLDDSMALLPFHQVLLFTFTTVTTIGYGDIVPESAMAKSFCIFYCLSGTPLVFITLSKIGELLAEFYWICWAALMRREEDIIAMDVQRLPLSVITLMILSHSILGGFLFHFFLDDLPIFPAIYFCFISITTIGFGDICQKPESLGQTLIIILYLSSGISIMSTMIGAISDHLRRIHYLGRNSFERSQDARIWFAGRQLTIRQLVSLVSQQFGVATIRLREVLDELDALLQLAMLQGGNRRMYDESSKENGENKMVTDNKSPDFCFNLDQHSASSSINTEQGQMIQALSTLHRLSVKGTRTFRSPSLNSFTVHSASAFSTMALGIDCRQARSMDASPYNTIVKNAGISAEDAADDYQHADELLKTLFSPS